MASNHGNDPSWSFSDDDFLNFHPNGSEVGHENDPPAWPSENEADASSHYQTPSDNYLSSYSNAHAFGHINTAKPVHTISSRHSIQTATHHTADVVTADEALAASYFGLHPTVASTSNFHNSSSATSRTSFTSSPKTSATSRDPDSSTRTPTKTPDPTSTFSVPTPTTTADPDDPEEEEEKPGEDPNKPAQDAADTAENALSDAGGAGAGAVGGAAGSAAGAGGGFLGGIGSAIGGLVGAGAGVAAGAGAGAAAGHHENKPADPVTVISNVATPAPTPETQVQDYGATSGANTTSPTVPETPEMAGLNLTVPQNHPIASSNRSVLERPDSFNTNYSIDPFYNATMTTLPFEPVHNASLYSNPFNTSHHTHPLYNETIPRLPFEPLHNTSSDLSSAKHHFHPLHNSTDLRPLHALQNTTSTHHLTTHLHNKTTFHHNSTRRPDVPPLQLGPLSLNRTEPLSNSTRHPRVPFRPLAHPNASHPSHPDPLQPSTDNAPAGIVSSAPHLPTLIPPQNSFCSNFAEPHYSTLTNISDNPSAAIQTTCGGPINNKSLSLLLLAIYKEVQGNRIAFPMNGQTFKYHKEVGGVTFDYTGINTGLAGAINAWNLLKPTVNYYFDLWHDGLENGALSWISKTVPDHLGPGHARALGKPVALGSPVVKVTICQKGSKCPNSSGVGP